VASRRASSGSRRLPASGARRTIQDTHSSAKAEEKAEDAPPESRSGRVSVVSSIAGAGDLEKILKDTGHPLEFPVELAWVSSISPAHRGKPGGLRRVAGGFRPRRKRRERSISRRPAAVPARRHMLFPQKLQQGRKVTPRGRRPTAGHSRGRRGRRDMISSRGPASVCTVPAGSIGLVRATPPLGGRRGRSLTGPPPRPTEKGVRHDPVISLDRPISVRCSTGPGPAACGGESLVSTRPRRCRVSKPRSAVLPCHPRVLDGVQCGI